MALWPPLKFANLGGADFASRFSVVMFFSLLIERTVEILMTIWRSEKAAKLEAGVRRLVSAGIKPDDPKMVRWRGSNLQTQTRRTPPIRSAGPTHTVLRAPRHPALLGWSIRGKPDMRGS